MNSESSLRMKNAGSHGPKLKQACLDFGGGHNFIDKDLSPNPSNISMSFDASVTEQINHTPVKTRKKTNKSANFNIITPAKSKPLMVGFLGKLKEKIKQVRLRMGFGNIENLNLKQLNWISDASHYSVKQDLISKQDSKSSEKGKKKGLVS